MGASWQAFYAHLCAASIIRAMPETEIPPAMRGDLYCISSTPQSIRLAAYCQPKNPLAISKRFLSAFIPKTDEKSAIMLEQSENMNLAERSL